MVDFGPSPEMTDAKIYVPNREKSDLMAAVDQFADAMKYRLLKKYEEGKRGWDSGYPSKALENEILLDAADMRSTESQIRKRDELTDIGCRAMMLYGRSKRLTAGEEV